MAAENNLNNNTEFTKSPCESYYDSDESYTTTRERFSPEEEDEDELFPLNWNQSDDIISLGSDCSTEYADFTSVEEDSVYVVVGKGQSSADALSWTLTSDFVNPSTIIHLLHIFPQPRFIPTPLGLLPKRVLCKKVVDKYMKQERKKAEEFLLEFLNSCSSSRDIGNKVYAMLVESDLVGKTILNLIPYLNIKKLVLCTTRNNTTKTDSRRAKLRKNGLVHEILMNASKSCDVKIVCEGKQVMDDDYIVSTPSSSCTRKSKNLHNIFCFDPEFISERNIFWVVLRG